MNLPYLKKYLAQEELNIQSAYAAFFPLDLVYAAYANSSKIHGIPFDPVCCYLSFRKMTTFYQILSQNKLDRVADKIYAEYLKNPQGLETMLKAHADLTRKTGELWDNYQVKKKESSLERPEFLKFYNALVQTIRRWWEYAAIGEEKGQIIARRIIPLFQKKHNLDSAEAAEIFNTLAHPEVQTEVNQARKLFLEICLKIIQDARLRTALQRKQYSFLAKDKLVKHQLNEYRQRFFWLKTNFYQASPMTLEIILQDIFLEIKQNSASKIQREIKSIDASFQKIEEAKNKLEKQLILSAEDQQNITFAQKIIYWIDLRKVGMMQTFHFLLSFLADLSQALNVDYHTLALYRVQEIASLIGQKQKISSQELARREESLFAVFEKEKDACLFYGQEALALFQLTRQKQTQELKGMVACTGAKKIIRGKVCLVKNLKKDKFLPGTILVTSMTRNEIVPFMRKAKAIITDEGGLACHAAIVSRELNVPCVIGTRIATQKLKNGVQVELDLTQGTIKVIA